MASLAQVDLRSVSAYEAGKTTPKNDVLQRVADKTAFPVDFFFGDDVEEPNPETVSFRSMRKMTARQRDMAVGQGTLANLVCKYIEENFDLPKADIPDLSYAPTPEAAAQDLRQYWGIGNLPIPNLVHLLELKGVRIFSLSIDAREVDAFSTWQGERPMIFLNTYKTAERSRMDAAHELAHLALHRHAFSRAKDVESEAKDFASAFLMPKASMIALNVRSPSYKQLVALKRTWKVAVAALNYRLYGLDMMSEWHYRTNWVEIAKYGRETEPNGIPRENSQILAKVFSALHEEGTSRADVARELCIPRSEIEELMFGLAFTAIEGGAKSQMPRYGVNLRLVDKN